jgi:hypothetical protein
MPHVFLSYSSNEKLFAEILEVDLEIAGHPTWRDTSDIEGGSEWANAIEEALADSYVLIAVLSNTARESEWVAKELHAAETSHTPIIPILWDEGPIPTAIADKQAVDFSRVQAADGIEQLAEYRKSLAKLLGAVNASRPVLVLLRRLETGDDDAREEAARGLGELGDSIAVDALTLRLEDHAADVRFASARALGKIGVPAGFKPLVRALGDEDPDVIAAALVALGRIGQTDAIEVITEKLEHEDRFVRAAGARALGYLRAASAVRRLVYMMRNDPISQVRDSASAALCKIGGGEAERALDRAQVDCADVLAGEKDTSSRTKSDGDASIEFPP